MVGTSSTSSPICPCGSPILDRYPVCSDCWYQTAPSIRHAYIFIKRRKAATLAHMLAAAAKRKRAFSDWKALLLINAFVLVGHALFLAAYILLTPAGK